MSRYEPGHHSHEIKLTMRGTAPMPAPAAPAEPAPAPPVATPAPARPSLLDRVRGYFDKLSKDNRVAFMTDAELSTRIDADGQHETEYTREYRRRAAFRRQTDA